jgi:Cu-Zn family superoxide dismutase
MRSLALILTTIALGATAPVQAQTTPMAALHADMALATPAGPGASVGQITMTQTPSGVMFALDLHGLTPGQHGFHIHVNPSCTPTMTPEKTTPAGGAGGHLDPAKTGMHMGPMGEGHLGDLPVVQVDAGGDAHLIVTAPRITTLDQLRGHSLMIHAGGDNYADQPAPLGGGGARVACGVIAG